MQTSTNTLRLLGLMALTALAAPAQAQLFPNLGGQRAAISALTFLKNDLSPRSTGMGGANATMQGDVYSATINPAQVAEVKSTAVGVSGMRYTEGINHTLVAATVPVKNAGNVYANVHMLNMASEKVRTEFSPEGTGEYFSAYSLAAQVGYSRDLSSRFSIGVGVKYLREQLAQYAANGVAADVGFLYRTDWRNLRFGAALQHFGTNTTLKGNFTPDLLQNGTTTVTEGYPAPTLFKMGASMDALRTDEHLITAHLQLNHPNDNAENIRIGGEYVWADMLMFRAGVKLGVVNERVPSFGLGYRYNMGGHKLQIDYGVNPTRYLGLIHSVGLSFTFGSSEEAPMQQAEPNPEPTAVPIQQPSN